MIKYILSMVCFLYFSLGLAQDNTQPSNINQAQANMLRPLLKDYIFKVRALGLEMNKLSKRTDAVLASLSDKSSELKVSDADAIKTTDNYSFSDVVNNTKYLDSSTQSSGRDLKLEAELIVLTNDVNMLPEYASQLNSSYRKVVNLMSSSDDATSTLVLNELGYSDVPVLSEQVIASNIEKLNKSIQNLNSLFNTTSDSSSQ